MFTSNRQRKLSLFDFPLGELNPDNRWVILEELIPWDLIDDIYAEKFAGRRTGKPAYPSRMAFGALLIQQILSCSDRELVLQVAENPYLQYLLGLESFKPACPFGASTLVDFRKRFTKEDMDAINGAITCAAEEDDEDDEDPSDDSGSLDEDALIMDATVIPASIRYPQDTSLLFEVRRKLESMIDDLCAQTGAKRPRTYRRIAKGKEQAFSKRRKKTSKSIRSCIKGQLAYIKRDLKSIGALIEKDHASLTDAQSRTLTTCFQVFEQQQEMHRSKTHAIPDRIVSISQPWVRPMVRGKAKAPVEFGAKVHTLIERGMAILDGLSFDPFNESGCLAQAAEGYKTRHGRYPSSILADKIYQTRKNRAWCKKRGIRLSGPKLGRPSKDEKVRRAERAQLKADTSKRNLIECAFGTLKGSFGLERVSVKLQSTTICVIGMAHIAFNLKKLARLFCALIQWHAHTATPSQLPDLACR